MPTKRQVEKYVRESPEGIDTHLIFEGEPLKLIVSGSKINRTISTTYMIITTRQSGSAWRTRVFWGNIYGSGLFRGVNLGEDENATRYEAGKSHYQTEREIEEHYRFPQVSPLIVERNRAKLPELLDPIEE